MTYLKVLGSVAVLAVAFCSGFAQTRISTSLMGSNEVVPNAKGMLFSDSLRPGPFALNASGQRTMEWEVNEDSTTDGLPRSYPLSLSLLGSVSGGDSNGPWTLSLADLDSGPQSQMNQRG